MARNLFAEETIAPTGRNLFAETITEGAPLSEQQITPVPVVTVPDVTQAPVPESVVAPPMDIAAAPAGTEVTKDATLMKLKELPEIGEWKEGANLLDLDNWKLAGLANITWNDKELMDIFASQIEGSKPFTYTDVAGEEHYLIDIPKPDGGYESFWINKPGISVQDALKGGAAAAGGYIAGGLRNLFGRSLLARMAGTAAGEAGLQSGLEAIQTAAGGEFNPEDVVTAAAAGALGEGVGEVIQRGAPAVKEFISTRVKPASTPEQLEKMDFNEIIKMIDKDQAEDLALRIGADQDLRDLSIEMGISLNPDHYATDVRFIDFMQSMKGENKELLAKEVRATEQIQEKANEFLQRIEANPDQYAFSNELRGESKELLSELQDQAKKQWKVVDDAIKSKFKTGTMKVTDKSVFLDPIKSVLDQRSSSLRPDLLTKEEKQLSSMLSDGNPISWSELSEWRRKLGVLERRANQSQSDDSTMNAAVYGRLQDAVTETQRQLASFAGEDAGAAFTAAMKGTAIQKQYEKGLQKTYGKELLNNAKFKDAARSIINNGDPKLFNQIIETAPDDMKPKVAATVLGQMLSSGKKGAKGEVEGLDNFVNNYSQLMSQKGASNQVMKYLTKDQRKELDNLNRLAKGIVNARRYENRSNTSKALIDILKSREESGNGIGALIGKMTGYETAGQMAGIPFAGAAVGLAQGAGEAVKKKFSKELSDKAMQIVESPAFTRALTTLEKTGNDQPLWLLLTKAGLTGGMSYAAQSQLPEIKPAGVPMPQ